MIEVNIFSMDFPDFIVLIFPFCGLLILVVLMGIGLNYLVLKRAYRRIGTCPQCGAEEAAELIDTQEIVIANNVDYRRPKPVRIKEIKVTDQLQCSVCQHVWTRSFIQKDQVRLEDGRRKS
jgi:hypothetical protein